MKQLYFEQDYQLAKKKQKSLFLMYLILSIIFVISVIVICLIQTRIHYRIYMIINIILTILFLGFTIYFFDLKYSVVRAYVKMYYHILTASKETLHGQFKAILDEEHTKDKINFKKLIVQAQSEKDKKYYNREILVERNIQLPNWTNEFLTLQTQNGILVAYEVEERI